MFLLLFFLALGGTACAVRTMTPGCAAAEPPMLELRPSEPVARESTAAGERPLVEIQPSEPLTRETDQVPAREDWRLLLVNPWNPLPEDHAVELAALGNGHAVDARICHDLRQMMDDCRAAGLEPVICSSYRTQETQQRLYENKIRRLMDTGLPREEAAAQAGTVVAVPGTSEHQTGLALDIVDASYQVLDSAQASTAVQQWLMEHSWEYGFVLRYPDEKSEITGIIYEPWHYRYVGRKAAGEMRELGLCLEEYLEWLRDGEP